MVYDGVPDAPQRPIEVREGPRLPWPRPNDIVLQEIGYDLLHGSDGQAPVVSIDAAGNPGTSKEEQKRSATPDNRPDNSKPPSVKAKRAKAQRAEREKRRRKGV